jgi:mRNA interferase RelE/StbE
MPLYNITFARSARKELQVLTPDIAERILAKIEKLTINPRPSGCKKLHGAMHRWRIRVGEYRIIYDIDDNSRVVDVSVIRHRNEAYQ